MDEFQNWVAELLLWTIALFYYFNFENLAGFLHWFQVIYIKKKKKNYIENTVPTFRRKIEDRKKQVVANRRGRASTNSQEA